MKAKIKKWGNSLAVRLPQSIAENSNLSEDSEVELNVEDGNIILKPMEKRYVLKELLKGVNKNNIHEEVDFGPTSGSEFW